MTRYRTARREFLEELGIAASNRDPLAEFSERFVGLLIDGRLAESRVAKGYDLIDPAGVRVQVRYLANPADVWINEHRVEFTDEMDAYAVVLVEALEPTAVLWFNRDGLAETCRRLGKRHPDQARVLQLTRVNAASILADPAPFRPYGVRVWRGPEWEEALGD